MALAGCYRSLYGSLSMYLSVYRSCLKVTPRNSQLPLPHAHAPYLHLHLHPTSHTPHSPLITHTPYVLCICIYTCLCGNIQYSAHAIRSMFIPILPRLFFGGHRARRVRAIPGFLVLLLWVWQRAAYAGAPWYSAAVYLQINIYLCVFSFRKVWLVIIDQFIDT